jgi:hypothetical protein
VDLRKLADCISAEPRKPFLTLHQAECGGDTRKRDPNARQVEEKYQNKMGI